MVKLQALRKRQVHQHHAVLRQLLRAPHRHQGRALLAQALGKPRHAAPVRGHHGRKALLRRGGVHDLCQRVQVRVRVVLTVCHLREAGRHALALHGGQLHALVRVHQARKQARDLWARSVARQQLALLHAAVRGLEDLPDLLKRGRALVDGLVAVAQQQEVRAAKVARQHHELRLRVVLHLVYHHVARVVRAMAGHEHLQEQPLRRAHVGLAQHAAAQAVQAQPREVLDVVVRRGKARRQQALGVRQDLVVVRRRDDLAKRLDLLVHVHGEHLLLQLLVVGHRRDAAVQSVVQLVLHQGHHARPHPKALELAHRARHRSRAQQHGVAHAHVAQVRLVERRALKAALKPRQRLRAVVRAGRAVGQAHARQKAAPGERLRIGLAQGGEDGVYVLLEHVVWREEVHLVRPQGLALAIEQKRDALQQHGRLARSRDAVYQEHRHVVVAHHAVLLALDGRRDGLQLLRVVAPQRAQKQRVLDCDRRVEVRVQLVARDVKLPAQLQVHRAHAAVHLVRGGAHLLVVVRLGHGVAPVHDERHAPLVRHAGRANVHVACGPAGAHLQAHLRKVRLPKQHDAAAQLLYREVVLLVVRVDHGVQRLDRGERLHGLVRAAKVDAHLVREVLQVLRGLLVLDLDLFRQDVAHLFQLRVYLRQVLLLLREDLVFHRAPMRQVRKGPR